MEIVSTYKFLSRRKYNGDADTVYKIHSKRMRIREFEF